MWLTCITLLKDYFSVSQNCVYMYSVFHNKMAASCRYENTPLTKQIVIYLIHQLAGVLCKLGAWLPPKSTQSANPIARLWTITRTIQAVTKDTSLQAYIRLLTAVRRVTVFFVHWAQIDLLTYIPLTPPNQPSRQPLPQPVPPQKSIFFSSRGDYKSSLTDFRKIFRTHLTKFQYIFYIDRAS